MEGGALRGGAHGGGHMEGGTLFEGVAGHFWCVHQRESLGLQAAVKDSPPQLCLGGSFRVEFQG